MDSKKVIVITAPSGAGKTTIVKKLLQQRDDLAFSISACTRSARPGEQHGVDYYFLTAEEFDQGIADNAFLEWEEVYPGKRYGTLRQEVQRLWEQGKTVLFDIDVQGAISLKKHLGSQALTIFIQPPDKIELERRLRNRKTENEESLGRRIAKSTWELSFASKFDQVVINDDLDTAVLEVQQLVDGFLS